MDEIEKAMETLDRGSPRGADAKVNDDFPAPPFGAYFRKLGLPNLMSKKTSYELAGHVPENEMDPGKARCDRADRGKRSGRPTNGPVPARENKAPSERTVPNLVGSRLAEGGAA